jgi:ParB family chromosome partitioning protein
MAKLKGLGRGLDSLLGGDMDDEGNEVQSTDSLKTLKVTQLKPGKYQPRSFMDEAALNTLAESIKSQGIMQPILVRELAEDEYEIIAGERRWRASQIAGLEDVPVIIREIEDDAALAMALIENIQRENLNPLEEAQGIKRLIDEFNMTHEKAAEAVGRSRAAVSNLLRLLTLCAPVQALLMQGKLDMGHARSLIGLSGAHQVIIAERIIKDQLSVREAEQMVRAFNEDEVDETTETVAEKKPAHEDQDVKRLEEALSDKLGAVVNIKSTAKGGGTLKINYTNLDQLDGIITRITG